MPDPIASPHRRPGVDLAPRRSRVLLAGLPVLAVFTAFAAIVWLAYEDGTQGAPVGEPPLIKAAATPIKLPATDADAAGDGSEVAEDGGVGQLWSDASPADQPERLLPPPEEPLSPEIAAVDQGEGAVVDQGEVAAVDQAEGGGPAGMGGPADEAARPPVEAPRIAALAAGEAEPSPAPGTSEAAAASRPDETPAADAPTTETATTEVAGSPPVRREAEAALDRLLAEVAGAETTEGEPAAEPPTAPVAEPPTAPVAEPPVVQPPMVEPAEVTAAVETAPTRPAENAPPPASAPEETAPSPPDRPEVRPAIAAAPSPPPAPASETPEATSIGAPARVAAIDGDYRIQLAAVRAEADAQRAWDLFQIDLGPVLSGLEPFFERADTANGVFYRVQVGPLASQQDAEKLCEELKQLNASCFVVRR